MWLEKPGFYCAFCRSPRPRLAAKGIRWNFIVAALLLSVFVSFVIWEALDPRSFVIFVLVVMVLEFAGQIHWKLQVICPHCGFDPVLYLKNRGLAAERVKDFLEKRKQDPRALLSHNPDLGMKLRRRSEVKGHKSDWKNKSLVVGSSQKSEPLNLDASPSKDIV